MDRACIRLVSSEQRGRGWLQLNLDDWHLGCRVLIARVRGDMHLGAKWAERGPGKYIQALG